MEYEDKTLKLISGVLLRSFLIAAGLLIIWIVGYLTMGDFWYSMHSKFYYFTRSQFSMIHYGGMLLFKMLSLSFMLCPFLAIEWLRRSRRKHG